MMFVIPFFRTVRHSGTFARPRSPRQRATVRILTELPFSDTLWIGDKAVAPQRTRLHITYETLGNNIRVLGRGLAEVGGNIIEMHT
jgi:hypothetical protein